MAVESTNAPEWINTQKSNIGPEWINTSKSNKRFEWREGSNPLPIFYLPAHLSLRPQRRNSSTTLGANLSNSSFMVYEKCKFRRPGGSPWGITSFPYPSLDPWNDLAHHSKPWRPTQTLCIY
jgi:hypothetical protein